MTRKRVARPSVSTKKPVVSVTSPAHSEGGTRGKDWGKKQQGSRPRAIGGLRRKPGLWPQMSRGPTPSAENKGSARLLQACGKGPDQQRAKEYICQKGDPFRAERWTASDDPQGGVKKKGRQ